MINGKRIAVVMPAYNAERTLEQTVRELPDEIDVKILVDDSSIDRTAALAESLGVRTFIHDRNYGYGRRPVIAKRSPPAPILWSCSIPITNTRRSSLPPWPV
jgi:cellulose synthase/poly-beta-1,6-N-acetylglucosamine synthase-like glycosyltransferase